MHMLYYQSYLAYTKGIILITTLLFTNTLLTIMQFILTLIYNGLDERLYIYLAFQTIFS